MHSVVLRHCLPTKNPHLSRAALVASLIVSGDCIQGGIPGRGRVVLCDTGRAVW